MHLLHVQKSAKKMIELFHYDRLEVSLRGSNVKTRLYDDSQ